MCHSVEMYLPEITRTAAEQRVGARCGAEAGPGFGAILAGLARLLKFEQVSKLLKNKDRQFGHVSWSMEREACATTAVVTPGARK
jgi:hypothetical protein